MSKCKVMADVVLSRGGCCFVFDFMLTVSVVWLMCAECINPQVCIYIGFSHGIVSGSCAFTACWGSHQLIEGVVCNRSAILTADRPYDLLHRLGQSSLSTSAPCSLNGCSTPTQRVDKRWVLRHWIIVFVFFPIPAML